jgi:antagonist of KipI
MDRFALRAANMLLGNPPGAVCIELLLGGLVLKALAPCRIAICGADLGARLDGQPLDGWSAAQLQPGTTLAFNGRRDGARAYIGIAGGFTVIPVLGSGSTYLAGGWGGFKGRVLRAGDQLEAGIVSSEHAAICWLPPDRRPGYRAFPTLRCVAGPHQEMFDGGTLAAFWGGIYTMNAASDRMGYRLDGPQIAPRAGGSLPSLGVLPGCLQVPPHGQPILLMADAQTTGGYPLIATVISTDLPLAAQLMPGDKVRFRRVSAAAAQTAARQRVASLETLGGDEEVEGAPI